MFAQDFFDFSSTPLSAFTLPASSASSSTTTYPQSSSLSSPLNSLSPTSGSSTTPETSETTAFKWEEDWLMSLEQPGAPAGMTNDADGLDLLDYDVPMGNGAHGAMLDSMAADNQPAATSSVHAASADDDVDVLNVTTTQLWSTPDAFACFASGGAHFSDTLGAIGSATDQHVGLQNSSKFLWMKPSAAELPSAIHVKEEQKEDSSSTVSSNKFQLNNRPTLTLKGLSSPETTVDVGAPSGSVHDDFSDIVTPDLVQVLNLSSAGLSCDDVLTTPDVEIKDYNRFYPWPVDAFSSKVVPGLIPVHNNNCTTRPPAEFARNSPTSSTITASSSQSTSSSLGPGTNGHIRSQLKANQIGHVTPSASSSASESTSAHSSVKSSFNGHFGKLSHFYNHFTERHLQNHGHYWHGHSQLQDRRLFMHHHHGLTSMPTTTTLTAVDIRAPGMDIMDHIMATSAAMAATNASSMDPSHDPSLAPLTPSHLMTPTSASSTSSSVAFFPTTIDSLPGMYNNHQHGCISAAVKVIPPPQHGYDAAVAAGAADTILTPMTSASITAVAKNKSRRKSLPSPTPVSITLPKPPPPSESSSSPPSTPQAVFAGMTATILTATGGRNAKVLQAFLEGGEAAAQAAAAELKPAKRKKRREVPKDSERYAEMRRKNNISSQRCRANRKQRASIQEQHMQNLDTENRRLRGVLGELRRRANELKASIVGDMAVGQVSASS